eukprot:6201350-Pleurochrysis_carterae.AAC.4
MQLLQSLARSAARGELLQRGSTEWCEQLAEAERACALSASLSAKLHDRYNLVRALLESSGAVVPISCARSGGGLVSTPHLTPAAQRDQPSGAGTSSRALRLDASDRSVLSERLLSAAQTQNGTPLPQGRDYILRCRAPRFAPDALHTVHRMFVGLRPRQWRLAVALSADDACPP